MSASSETIANWRRQRVVVASEAMPTSTLKHAEDQTVIAVQTLAHALQQPGCQGISFTDWAVVAAPNFFGRLSNANILERFQREGAWGVSPHLIPQQSLHAISGTFSQLLKSYGPNFGVGGGANSSVDAFLLAAALLADSELPGLWLALTGNDAELIPTPGTSPANVPRYQALVMALTAADGDSSGLHLSIRQTNADHPHEHSLGRMPEFHLSGLMEECAHQNEIPAGPWRIADSCWIEFENVFSTPEEKI